MLLLLLPLEVWVCLIRRKIGREKVVSTDFSFWPVSAECAVLVAVEWTQKDLSGVVRLSVVYPHCTSLPIRLQLKYCNEFLGIISRFAESGSIKLFFAVD